MLPRGNHYHYGVRSRAPALRDRCADMGVMRRFKSHKHNRPRHASLSVLGLSLFSRALGTHCVVGNPYACGTTCKKRACAFIV
jgi:hypothetical protein